MKTKKLLSLVLSLIMVFSMMATLGITASAAQAIPHLHAEATCDKYPDAKHVLVTAVDKSNVTVTLYDTDGTKTENQTLPVSYFSELPAVGEWCFGYFMYYGKCDGNHEKSGGNETDTYLDLDDGTATVLDSKELEQGYSLTVNEGEKANAAKVKLTWEIKDIDATRTDNQVWDTENLCWTTGTSTTSINQVGTAKFTLENYSSIKVEATASFKAEGDFNGTASYDVKDGRVVIDTANGNDEYSAEKVPTKVINATITTDKDDFKTLDATAAAKYGTYTVTIGKAATPVAGATFTDGTTLTWAELMDTKNGEKYDYHPERIVNNVFIDTTGYVDTPFSYCAELVSIVIPETITGFCRNAFDGCANLETVTFLGNYTELAGTMFQNCHKLKSVVLPQNITVLNDYLFNNAENLSSIDIPVTVTEMKIGSFSCAKNLVINYAGTKAQWDAITKTAGQWNNQSNIKVVCTDSTFIPFSWIKVQGNVYSYELEKGKSTTINVSIIPAVNDESELEWKSSDETIATVDQNGVVTATNKAGKCQITCKCKAHENIKQVFTVKVKKEYSDYLASAGEYTDANSTMNISISDAYSIAKELAASKSKTVYLVYYIGDITEDVLYVSSDDASATAHEMGYFDFVYDGETPVKDTDTEVLCAVPKD